MSSSGAPSSSLPAAPPAMPGEISASAEGTLGQGAPRNLTASEPPCPRPAVPKGSPRVYAPIGPHSHVAAAVRLPSGIPGGKPPFLGKAEPRMTAGDPRPASATSGEQQRLSHASAPASVNAPSCEPAAGNDAANADVAQLLTPEEERTEAAKACEEATAAMAAQNPNLTRLNVNGVPVFFPFQPYRSQRALMHNVIKVARDGGHALIESPTGTGKSMALLCSALAFQVHSSIRNAVHNREVRKRRALEESEEGTVEQKCAKENLDRFRYRKGRKLRRARVPSVGSIEEKHGSSAMKAAVDSGNSEAERDGVRQPHVPGTSECCAPTGSPRDSLSEAKKHEQQRDATSNGKLSSSRTRSGNTDDLEDEDCLLFKKFRDATWQNNSGGRRLNRKAPETEPKPANADLPPELQIGMRPDDFDLERLVDEEPQDTSAEKFWRTPRIFYASRTHAQLAQVVGELRRSGYKPKMTLLASRSEYCLNSYVKNSKSASVRNERCRNTVRESSCSFYHFQQDVADSVRVDNEPFDIEDLNQRASKMGGCSYFAAVELYKHAELILCPYNYLIDASIRQAREISVRGDIVIFDEAHNIEDHARESASFTGDLGSFRAAIEEITELDMSNRLGPRGSELHRSYKALQELLQLVSALGHRIVEAGELRFDGCAEVAVFSRDDMLRRLEQAGLCRESMPQFAFALHVIGESKDEDYDTRQPRSKDSSSRPRTDSHSPELDAGAALKRGRRSRKIDLMDNEETDEADGRKRRKYGKGRPGCSAVPICGSLVMSLMYTLGNPESFTLAMRRVNNEWESKTEWNLWCLNAAVPFKALSDSARCIIVTSGTLAPIDSFSGELNVQFAVSKSLPHVVDVQRQVFTAVVASGPGPYNVQMNTTFGNAANFAWQDALGAAILSYCTVIPGGVLVFFPSYRLLNNIMARWKQHGLYEKLENTKGLVVTEPNARGAAFDEMMMSYTRAANAPDGAVMFGVCRGKISEGLDFKDAAARGVVIVGIPYPAAKCPQLLSKRQWNDRERIQSNRSELLSGRSWYEMQAFRALNQAVGRCVRHRHDYGAIILLDQRFRADSVKRQLPSWVQGSLRAGARSTHEATMLGLSQFFANLENSDIAVS